MHLASPPHKFSDDARQRRRPVAVRLLLLPSLLLLILADPARAVQSHGGPEGLAVHQLGHVLFAGGMLFLLVRSRLSNWTGPGWNSFKGFLWLTIGWNVLTFAGHQVEIGISDENFLVSGARVAGFRVDTLAELFYYLTQLDHLLLMPALLLLMCALKQWASSPESGS